MASKAGKAYGATTTNAIANKVAAIQIGHNSMVRRGRKRNPVRTISREAPRAIANCSLSPARSEAGWPASTRARLYARRAAKATKAKAARTRIPDHDGFISSRPRIPRYNRLGEKTRRTAVIAATGMKSAGVENTSVTNHTAMRLDARRAAITTAKTKRLAENI